MDEQLRWKIEERKDAPVLKFSLRADFTFKFVAIIGLIILLVLILERYHPW